MAAAESAAGGGNSAALRQMAFLLTGHGLTHFSMLILPTAALAMAGPGSRFGTDYASIIALLTGFLTVYGLCTLPQGWLVARLGRKAMLALFFFGTACCLALTGLAPDRFWLAVALAATGAFVAIYHPVGVAMLVEAAGERPGRALGLNGLVGNGGAALAPMLTGLLVPLGWRYGFLAPAAFAALVGVAWLLHRVPHLHAARLPRHYVKLPPRQEARVLALLMVMAFCAGLTLTAFTMLLPKLMQERLAGSDTLLPLVGVAAFAATVCGALSQLTVGHWMDRTTVRRLYLPLSAGLLPALVLLSLLHGWVAVLLAGVVTAALFGQGTITEAAAAQFIAPERRTRMYSVRFFVAFLGSAGAAPLVALLYERTGSLAAVTTTLAGVAAIGLGCAVIFPDRPGSTASGLGGEGEAGLRNIDLRGAAAAPHPAP